MKTNNTWLHQMIKEGQSLDHVINTLSCGRKLATMKFNAAKKGEIKVIISKQELVKMYGRLSTEQIASKLKCGPDSIRGQMVIHGIPTKKLGHFSTKDYDIQDAKRMFLAGSSLSEIRQKVGVNEDKISVDLRKLGVDTSVFYKKPLKYTSRDRERMVELYRSGITMEEVAVKMNSNCTKADVQREIRKVLSVEELSRTIKNYSADLKKEDVNDFIADIKSGLSGRKLSKKYGISVPKALSLKSEYQQEPSTEAIVAEYNKCGNIKKVGRLFKIGPNKVKEILDRNGVQWERTKIDENRVIGLYVEEKRSIANIMKLVHASYDTIISIIKSAGVPVRGSGYYSQKFEFDKFDIIAMHHQDKMTLVEIAEAHECSVGTIKRFMVDNDIDIEVHNKPDSLAERKIYEYIAGIYDGSILRNHTLHKGSYELDIYIPELRLGIEYNGGYWHRGEKKGNLYHQKKYQYFKDLDIRLIQIWEHVWEHKTEQIKNLLKSLLSYDIIKTYGRLTNAKVVELDVARKFMIENHIQGFSPATHYYGLYKDSNLLQLMTFKEVRKGTNSYEIGRLCTKSGHFVVGGASKLFKHFLKTINPKEVTSYSDADYFTGRVYSELGMEYLGITEPGYFWYKSGKVKSRQQTMRHKLEGYPSTMTEKDIMRSLGWHDCYNSGNHKFLWSGSNSLR